MDVGLDVWNVEKTKAIVNEVVNVAVQARVNSSRSYTHGLGFCVCVYVTVSDLMSPHFCCFSLYMFSTTLLFWQTLQFRSSGAKSEFMNSSIVTIEIINRPINYVVYLDVGKRSVTDSLFSINID